MSKPFKKCKTGVRETHEIQWKTGEGAEVYTFSALTEAERIPEARLDAFTKENLNTPILKSNTSSRLPLLFLPEDGEDAVRATAASATAMDQARPKRQKARAFDTALACAGVEYGDTQGDSQNEFEFTTETCADLTGGWAR